MQGLLIVLLAFRLVFLLGAAGLCVYGFIAAGESGVPGLWRVAYAAGFLLSLAMIWALWRSFRALRKG
jgi:hypothetical protein